MIGRLLLSLARVCAALSLTAGVVVLASLIGYSPNASAITGTALSSTGADGPITVTVTPTDSLTDGQVISIHADASSGVMFEIRAHICASNIGTVNTGKFAFTGTFCFSAPDAVPPGSTLGAGDYETFVTLNNTTSGDLTFKAGIGSVTWNDETNQLPHTLTCDSTHSCTLVAQFQSSVSPNTFWFKAPLTYAGGGGTTTTTTTGGSTTTTTGGSTTTTAGGSTTTTQATTTTTRATTTTTQATTTTTHATTTTTRPTTTTTTHGTTTTTGGSTTTTARGSTTTTTAGGSTTTTTAGNGSGNISVDTSQVAPNGTFTVTSSGWMPNDPVTVTFHSTPVTLGTLTANESGQVQGSFTVPPSAETGTHTVELTGTSSTNSPQTQSITVTVTGSTSGSSTGSSTGSTTGSSTGTITSGTLPFTGSNTREVASAGVLLIALGLVALDVSLRLRRRTAA